MTSDRGSTRRITVTAAYLTSKITIEFQEKEGFKPRSDSQPYLLTLPLDWAIDPFKDRNWSFQLHGWRMMDPYLKRYLTTRDVGLLSKAWKYLLDWSEFHDTQAAEYSWYDMSTGLRALKLAVFLDAIDLDGFTPPRAEQDVLIALIEQHLENLVNPANINPNNHGLFQLAGLKQLATRSVGRDGVEPDLVERALRFSETAVVELMAAFYTLEGVNKEHSPSYHMFVGRIIEQLDIERLFPDIPGVVETLRAARGVTPWMTHPDGVLARFGDTTGTGVALTKDLIPDLSDDDVIVRDLSASGLVTARTPIDTPVSQSGMLIVTGAQWSHSHKHADDLAYELFHKGKSLVIDGGKFAYKRHFFRRYVKSASAHSSLSFLSTEILPGEERGSWLSSPSIRDGAVLIEGEIDRPGRLRHRRTFLYAPDRWLIVTDEYESALDDAVVSSILLDPRLEANALQDSWLLTDNGERVADLLIHGADEVIARRGWDDETGRAAPAAYAGWHSPAYGVIAPTTCIQAISSMRSGTIGYAIVLDPDRLNEAHEEVRRQVCERAQRDQRQ